MTLFCPAMVVAGKGPKAPILRTPPEIIQNRKARNRTLVHEIASVKRAFLVAAIGVPACPVSQRSMIQVNKL